MTSTPAFGVHAVYSRAIHAQPEVAAALGRLLADPRWPWPLPIIRPTQKWKAPPYPWPRGKHPHATLASTATAILTSKDTIGVRLVAGSTDARNHAYAHLDGGHADEGDEYAAYPFDVRMYCRAHPAIDAWLELVHEVLVLVDAKNGSLIARPDERYVWSLLYGTPDGGRPDLPPDHPYNVNTRVNGARRKLGAQYIRPAEWGTYLAPEHVAAIGRDKLVAAVPFSRDVGPLLYLQCTTSAADAFGPEARERRLAVAELIAPLCV